MGRATRWLKGLFGIKSRRENSNSSDRNDNKQSTFGHSQRDFRGFTHNPGTIPPNITSAEATWIRSYYNETEEEQNDHAIAVAAATAAAADAAIAAAQAAVAVVRLTSNGRGTMFGGGRERWGAVKIQTLFRGYLARKALRALKGLVKLQALVRGYLVRKQATATIHTMQALNKAQNSVRSQRARARKSLGRFEEIRSEPTMSVVHRRRLSASFDTTINPATDEGAKIVEVDTGRPKSRYRRTNTSISDFGDDPSHQTLSCPIPTRTPPRLSKPNCGCNVRDSEWGVIGDECKLSTAQSTPQLVKSGSSSARVTPAKSVCGDNFFTQYVNFPNYMANTESFKAKLRSQSAPKQRPGPGSKRRLSLSAIKMQRSCSEAQEETLSSKNAALEFLRERRRNFEQNK